MGQTSFWTVDAAGAPGKLRRPPIVSSEPGRMLAFATFQGVIRGMLPKTHPLGTPSRLEASRGSREMIRYYPRLGVHNVHRTAVARHFGGIAAGPADLREDVTFFFLCYTNRCGSNYLADLLVATRRFKRAGEFFNADAIVNNAREHGHRNLQDYFAWLAGQRATARGLVACKLAVPHLELLGEAGLLDQAVNRGNFVFMSRQDLLAQAISLEIALQTERWTSLMTGTLPDNALTFKPSRLDRLMADIEVENREFETFFAANGIEPVRVQYERLVADPQKTLDAIGKRLGFRRRLHPHPERLTLSRQSGPLNTEWRERYLTAVTGNGGLIEKILNPLRHG